MLTRTTFIKPLLIFIGGVMLALFVFPREIKVDHVPTATVVPVVEVPEAVQRRISDLEASTVRLQKEIRQHLLDSAHQKAAQEFARQKVSEEAPEAPQDVVVIKPASPKSGVVPPKKSSSITTVEQPDLDLKEWYKARTKGPGMNKFEGYFDMYDRSLSVLLRSRDVSDAQTIKVLEIGVQSGGSIVLWQRIFGKDRLEYHGIDSNSNTTRFHKESDRIYIHVGDPEDATFLKAVGAHGQFDIIVQTGPFPKRQEALVRQFWDNLVSDGVMIVEDTHVSYHTAGMGALAPGNFLQFAKSLTEHLNAYHMHGLRAPSQIKVAIDKWSNTLFSVVFYDAAVVFQKMPARGAPRWITNGDEWLTDEGTIINNNPPTDLVGPIAQQWADPYQSQARPTGVRGRRNPFRTKSNDMEIPDSEEPAVLSKSMVDWFWEHKKGPGIYKLDHYFDVYARSFAGLLQRRRDATNIKVMEIGVQSGGSVLLWEHVWGIERLEYHGVDINRHTARFARFSNKTTIHIGSQADVAFLKSVGDKYGPFDVIIDDGSHQPVHNKICVETMWEYLVEDGVMLVEDTHATYWIAGMTTLSHANFLEMAKNMTESVNAYHMHSVRAVGAPEFPISVHTKTISSIAFYDSVVVFQRIPARNAPRLVSSGNEWLTEDGTISHKNPQILEYEAR
jgi:hypothetical protein